MPIFDKQLGRVGEMTPTEALKSMANHIRYIQEQLEFTLMNLDSSNVTEINLDETDISSTGGTISFTGNSFSLKGSRGEIFEAGEVNGKFRFTLRGPKGAQIMYLTSDGELVITNNATIRVDGGEW